MEGGDAQTQDPGQPAGADEGPQPTPVPSSLSIAASHLSAPTTIQRVKSERTFDITPINFKYTKPRAFFGKQPQFLEDHVRMHCGLRANKRFRPLFFKKSFLDEANDTMEHLRSVGTNTPRIEYKTFSLMHVEGAWPKEVNPKDTELVERTRRKLQKEESYLAAVPGMTREADYLTRYNNTLHLYDRYFEESNSKAKTDTMPYANVVSVYKNPFKLKRPVSKINFAPGNAGRVAVTYCPYEFDPDLRLQACEAYFWEIENPTRPEGLVRSAAQIVDVGYHPKDVHSICGALFTGQVCTWDNRIGPSPQNISPYGISHTDVCTRAMWINSKSGYEFFSSGLDGQVIWWDERNMSERLDTTLADPVKGSSEAANAVPITALEYEHTLPSKFLAGSQFGDVMVFTKKGKSPKDRLLNLYRAHKGPVRAIHRNPVFVRNFMSCGDYHLRIFAEECRESAIMWTAPSDSLYTYANWLSGRPCALVASRVDGCLEFWDLLVQGASSILTTKISEDPLSIVCPSDTGMHVAAGTTSGDIRMVKVCPLFYEFDKNDKSALAACFERESRREMYLEGRHKEEEVKKEVEGKPSKQEPTRKFSFGQQAQRLQEPRNPFDDPNLTADKAFFEMLADEKKKQGVNAFPDKKQASRAFSNVMRRGRMAEKHKRLKKAGKKKDSHLGVEQMLGINEETLKMAHSAVADVEKARAAAIAAGLNPDDVVVPPPFDEPEEDEQKKTSMSADQEEEDGEGEQEAEDEEEKEEEAEVEEADGEE